MAAAAAGLGACWGGCAPVDLLAAKAREALHPVPRPRYPFLRPDSSYIRHTPGCASAPSAIRAAFSSRLLPATIGEPRERRAAGSHAEATFRGCLVAVRGPQGAGAARREAARKGAQGRVRVSSACAARQLIAACCAAARGRLGSRSAPATARQGAAHSTQQRGWRRSGARRASERAA